MMVAQESRQTGRLQVVTIIILVGDINVGWFFHFGRITRPLLLRLVSGWIQKDFDLINKLTECRSPFGNLVPAL